MRVIPSRSWCQPGNSSKKLKLFCKPPIFYCVWLEAIGTSFVFSKFSKGRFVAQMAGKGGNHGVGGDVHGKAGKSCGVGVGGVAVHCMGKGKGGNHGTAAQKGWSLKDAEWGQGWDPTLGNGWGMDMGKGSPFWCPMSPTGWGGKPSWGYGPSWGPQSEWWGGHLPCCRGKGAGKPEGKAGNSRA